MASCLLCDLQWREQVHIYVLAMLQVPYCKCICLSLNKEKPGLDSNAVLLTTE